MTMPAHNTRSIFVGTGEFSFCRGATTREETKLLGYRDFDNVTAFKQEITNEREEHEGSYRGLKRVDEVFSIKQGLEYILKCDAFTLENVTLLLMGESGTNHTQAALAAAAADDLAFTADVPSEDDKWYDLYVSDEHVRALGSVDIFSGTPLACQAEADDDTITDAAHGLENGDKIIITAVGGATGLAVDTIYYVRDSTPNTFKVALTAGGSAVNITADGSGTTYLPALTEDDGSGSGDYEVDLDLGRVRFLTDQTTTVYAYLTADEIAAGGENYMAGITPLQQATFEGYGRLVTFHQKSEKAFLDHQDFSCTVIPESIEESDGKKPVVFQLRVKVTTDEGNLLVSQRAIS